MVGQRGPAGNSIHACEDSPRARDRPPPAIGYDCRPVPPALAAPGLPSRARRLAALGPASRAGRRAACLTADLTAYAAAGLLLTACYSGDFFDRLVDPDATAAFRITRLALVDPHTYSGDALKCQDSTATFNQIFAENINNFNTNTTLVLHPLDPAVGSGTTMEIVRAMCVDGSPVNCTDKDVPIDTIVAADFNNSEGGTCGNPVAKSLNDSYHVDPTRALNKPTSPCFLSALIPSLSLQLAPELSMPLSNVQIYAAYDLDVQPKPQQLVSGVIFGFLPSGVAMTSIGNLNGAPFLPWSFFAGGGGCQPNLATPINDIDTVASPGDGVWMYFNFTAERVAWASESDPDPAPTSSSTGP